MAFVYFKSETTGSQSACCKGQRGEERRGPKGGRAVGGQRVGTEGAALGRQGAGLRKGWSSSGAELRAGGTGEGAKCRGNCPSTAVPDPKRSSAALAPSGPAELLALRTQGERGWV